MSTRKARTVPQLIRAYGIDRVIDFIAKGKRGGGLEKKVGEAYPAATPGVIRQLIAAARESKAAAQLTPKTKMQFQRQRERMAMNAKQPKQFEYYTRVKVALGPNKEEEVWNIRVPSSTQQSVDEIKEMIAEKVEAFRNRALGESKERMQNKLQMVEFEVVAITKKRK